MLNKNVVWNCFQTTFWLNGCQLYRLRRVVQTAHHPADGGDAFFQRLSVLRDAHADALAGVRVILRVDADEEKIGRAHVWTPVTS